MAAAVLAACPSACEAVVADSAAASVMSDTHSRGCDPPYPATRSRRIWAEVAALARAVRQIGSAASVSHRGTHPPLYFQSFVPPSMFPFKSRVKSIHATPSLCHGSPLYYLPPGNHFESKATHLKATHLNASSLNLPLHSASIIRNSQTH